MMRRSRRRAGFSLTEVVLAVATLTIGLLFVGGTFFVGVHYSTRSAEESIGAVVARDAVSLMRLYGLDLQDADLQAGRVVDYNSVAARPLDAEVFVYAAQPQYRWDALCQLVPGTSDLVSITVLVSRFLGDPQAAPRLRSLDVTVTDGRFIDVGAQPVLAQNQWVVDDDDLARVYRVTRGRAADDAPVRWALVPDPNRIVGGRIPDRLWTIPSGPTAGGTEGRTVYVQRDEVRF